MSKTITGATGLRTFKTCRPARGRDLGKLAPWLGSGLCLLMFGCTPEKTGGDAAEQSIPFAGDVTQRLLSAEKLGAKQAGTQAITVHVTLSPELKKQVALDSVVFIFARAESGPRIPLAILRRQVKDLPVSVSLDDSMAMAPNMKLSDFPSVVIGARVSKSGSANRQAGDIEGFSAPVQSNSSTPVQLVIDRVVDSSAVTPPPSPPTVVEHPSTGTRLKLDIPPQIQAAWKSVDLTATDRDGKTTVGRVNIGDKFALPNEKFSLRIVAFTPSFEASEGRITSRSNQMDNPAVLVQLIENDRVAAEGWIFQKFPQFNTFATGQFQVRLAGAYSSAAK